MPKHIAPPGGWEVRLDLECVLCTRTVATVQGPAGRPFVPRLLRVPHRDHVEAVRRRRCPYCTGRLWLQHREEVYVYAGQRRSQGASAS